MTYSSSAWKRGTQTFWCSEKAQKQGTVGISPLKKDGQPHSTSQMKSKIISEQFQSVFTKEDGGAIPLVEDPSLPDIPPLIISAAGVTKLLRKLKARNMSGPDNIPVRVLKELAEPLPLCLTAFFPLSLLQ